MEYYITFPFEGKKERSYTFEEIFDEIFDKPLMKNPQNTITYKKYWLLQPSSEFIAKMVNSLRSFNNDFVDKLEKPYEQYYSPFFIPKQKGGFRKITPPSRELKVAQRRLSEIFQDDFRALSHTSAFAYVKERCACSAVKKHQANSSRWFLKLDFHDFFGSTTKDFVLQQLSMIYPFCSILRNPEGRIELEKALDICFYEGGLPQGSPISPLLTNIIMTPIDYEINRYCTTHSPYFAYTRYADDIAISCKYNFNHKQVVRDLLGILSSFNTPFTLNNKKTTYGSSAGRNWILGTMYTSDCRITYGHKKKERFKAAVFSLLKDYTNGRIWSVDDANTLRGMVSYYNSIDAETTQNIIDRYNEKFNLDTLDLLSKIISGKIGG